MLGSGVSMQKRPGIKPCQPRHGGISPGLCMGKRIFLTSPSAQLTLGELRLLALVIQLLSQRALVFLVTANLFCTLTSSYGGCIWVWFCFFFPDKIYLELETNADQALAGFAVASLLKIVSIRFLAWPF